MSPGFHGAPPVDPQAGVGLWSDVDCSTWAGMVVDLTSCRRNGGHCNLSLRGIIPVQAPLDRGDSLPSPPAGTLSMPVFNPHRSPPSTISSIFPQPFLPWSSCCRCIIVIAQLFYFSCATSGLSTGPTNLCHHEKTRLSSLEPGRGRQPRGVGR